MKYVENLESVNKKITILNEGLKITEDAILLSKFIKKYNKKSGEFLEIGAGQGIISILISEISKVSKIFAVEIQKEIFEILGKNIKNNFLENKIIPINKNIKEITGQFDVIFSNPPYKKINSGKLPKKESEKISKFEIFYKIILKSALKDIFVGMRIGFGYAMRAIVGAEMIAASSGLGYLILDAEELSRADRIFVGIFTIGICGVLIDRIFLLLIAKFSLLRSEK